MGKNRNNNFIGEAPEVMEEAVVDMPVEETPVAKPFIEAAPIIEEPAPVIVEEKKPEPVVVKEEKKVETPAKTTKPGIKEEKAKKTATL